MKSYFLLFVRLTSRVSLDPICFFLSFFSFFFTMNFPNSTSEHPWDTAFFMYPDNVDHYNGVPIHPNEYINMWLSTCEGKKAVVKVMMGLKNPLIQIASVVGGLAPEKTLQLLVECAAEEFFAWALRFPVPVPEEDWETLKLIIARSVDATAEEVIETAKKKNLERQAQIEKEAQERGSNSDSPSSSSDLNSVLREKLEQLFHSNGEDHSSCS